jgi:hypothetical protein
VPADAALTGVATVSATEAWAVGDEAGHGVLAHFVDGAWTSSSYRISGRTVALGDVDATSTAAWAIGSVSGSPAQPLVLRNTGSGWRRVTVPSAAAHVTLRSVSIRSSTDVWLGGYDATHPVALHWDGTRLRVLATPFTGLALAVEAPFTGGVLLVGQASPQGTPQVWRRTASSWSQDPMPAPPSAQSPALVNLDSAQGQVWSVGFGQSGCCGDRSFVYRWTGSAWAENSPPAGNAALYDVLVARVDGHVVAVGQAECGSACPPPSHAVIWEWNGTAWQEQAVQGLDLGQSSTLTSLDGDGQGHRWAIGSLDGDPLLLQQCATASG